MGSSKGAENMETLDDVSDPTYYLVLGLQELRNYILCGRYKHYVIRTIIIYCGNLELPLNYCHDLLLPSKRCPLLSEVFILVSMTCSALSAVYIHHHTKSSKREQSFPHIKSTKSIRITSVYGDLFSWPTGSPVRNFRDFDY